MSKMMKSRADTDSDSDEEQYWDAANEKWWLVASNHQSVNNSPVKAGSSCGLPNEPSTPVSRKLVETLEAGLILSSGGARFGASSLTTVRSPSTASESQISRQSAQSPPSLQKRIRSTNESSFSYTNSTSSFDKTVANVPSPATSSGRMAILNEVFASKKTKSDDDSSSLPLRAGSSESQRTSRPIRGSKTMRTSTKVAFPYDPDTDIEVELLANTDTESSVPSTRQNSLLESSRTTSMTSVLTDVSVASSRKRSLDHRDEDASSPAPTTPPKIRRTTDGPQTRISPPTFSTELSRASTMPTPRKKKLYPELPVDEPSVFRVVPAILSQPSATPSTPTAPRTRPSQPISIGSSPTIPSSAPVSIPTLASQVTQRHNMEPPFALPSDSAAPDFSFLKRPEAVDLPLYIIAHDRDAQRTMDSKQLSWGVQWEIARGISNGTWQWSDVTPTKMDLMRGSNAEAAWKVVDIMKKGEVPLAPPGNLEIWREMDREQMATKENLGRGLGLMGKWNGEPNWWGGRIQQILRLVKAPANSAQPYTVRLEKLESRRSHRISRFLGSRRVNQMRIDNDIINKERDQVLEFLLQNFVLCGRIFRPFASKDGKVYLMETDQNYERATDKYYGDQYRISFHDFVAWHNPLDLNYNQPTSKWSARWALGLSTSRPVLEFADENLRDLPDLPLHDPRLGKLPAEKILTDGCGLINGAALTAIWASTIVKLPHRPVAAQGRIIGGKGMYALDPNDQSPTAEPCIKSRPSQIKITLRRPLHRAHRIFDLLSPSRVSMPSHLSMQTIICLSHNGVPDTAFKALIEQELDAIIKPLTSWDGPGSMLAVAKAIERAGHITGIRLQRFAGGSTKALGLSRDFHRDENEDDDDDDVRMSSNTESPLSSGRDSYSEAPRSVFESTYELILAGFHPFKLKLLHDKIQKIVAYVVENFTKNLRIPVSESVEAYIIPDPMGVLEEGQVYFCSSQGLSDQETGALFNTIIGPVIVGRNPTRLPSDLQLVNAVDHPDLHGWYDVIIFSTKGERSLASLLAGGDYDGDTVMLFWSRLLLDHFKNSPFSEPPADLLTRNFHQEIETLAKFSQRVSSQPLISQREFQKILLLGLADTKVGLYSVFQDNAVYRSGYGSAEAIRLAYMFNTCLDSPKTGHRLKKHVFSEDGNKYGGPRPSCMVLDQADPAGIEYQSNVIVQRSGSLGPFILDILVAAGGELKTRHLQSYDQLMKKVSMHSDRDLMRPFDEAKVRANKMKEQGYSKFSDELEAVTAHVKDIYERYKVFWALQHKPSHSRTRNRGKRKDVDAAAADIARQFAEGPENCHTFTTPNLAAIKASYAYDQSVTFGFSMAYRELCTIKAVASQHVPTTRVFAETMSIAPSFLRVLGDNSAEG